MKKSHLLWKILVVVMIVSAMMATFIACGDKYDCDVDGHEDTDHNYICDHCGSWLAHNPVDENRDDVCDVCNGAFNHGSGNHCTWGYHVDEDHNYRCDDCTTIFGAEDNWTSFIAEIDKVIDSMGSMGDLATMGGSLTAGIKFEQEEFTDKDNTKTEAVSHDIELKLDFGLDLASEFTAELATTGSENAFGFSITDNGDRIFGLWYVDNGTAKDNYILGQFGKLGDEITEVIKFNAPSLAETFANYPINVNVNMTDKVNGVNDIDASSVVDIVAGILPLSVTQGTNSTTYSIALTDYLFNKVDPVMTEGYVIGNLLDSLIGGMTQVTSLLQEVGLNTSLLDTLDSLLPGLALEVTFTRDAAGNTNGAAIGLSIAGESMSVDLYQPTATTSDGLIYDIFKTEANAEEGKLVINNGFGDIEMDVSLGYEFGSNAEQAGFAYSTKARDAYDAALKELDAQATEIGLINAAIEGEVLLGLGSVSAAPYDVKLAIDLDPSALTKTGLIKDAYVTKTLDGVTKGVKVDGEVQMVDAINLDTRDTVNAYDIILGAIDNLYIKLGDLEVRMISKTVDETTGKVTNFTVNLDHLDFIEKLLPQFGVDLSGMEELFKLLRPAAGSTGKEIDLGSSSIKNIVCGLLSGLVLKNVAYDDPEVYYEETTKPSGGEGSGEGSGESSGTSGSTTNPGTILDEITKYIKMFQFNRTDKNTLKLTVNEDDMNGAGVKFEATASVTRDADDTVNSLTLSLGADGLAIKGSDNVNTTLKMVDGWPLLQIGGEGNLFKAAINAVVEDERDIKEGTDAEGIKFYYLDKNGNGKYDEPVKNDKGELVGDEIIDAATAKSKDMNLTIGLNLKGIGYGVVPKGKQITKDNFGELFSNTNLAISVK